MTKLSYEIYDTKTGAVVLRFTDYDKMLVSLEDARRIYREGNEYCPLTYRQVYTPIVQRDDNAKSYIKFYKNKYAKA